MDIKAYSYSCLMADIPESLSYRLRAFSLLIPDSSIYEIEDVEHGRESEPHITIKYGIHTSDVGEVESIVSGFGSVRARLGSISSFHNEDCVVLKIDVESDDLRRLNKLVTSRLRCTDTFPVYKPHVTIAYLRHRLDDEFYYRRYCVDVFNGIEVCFDRLRFSTSDGMESSLYLDFSEMDKVARRLFR